MALVFADLACTGYKKPWRSLRQAVIVVPRRLWPMADAGHLGCRLPKKRPLGLLPSAFGLHDIHSLFQCLAKATHFSHSQGIFRLKISGWYGLYGNHSTDTGSLLWSRPRRFESHTFSILFYSRLN